MLAEGSPGMFRLRCTVAALKPRFSCKSHDAPLKLDTFREILRPTSGLRMTIDNSGLCRNLLPDLEKLIERILKRQLFELCEARKLCHATRISLSHSGSVSGSAVGE